MVHVEQDAVVEMEAKARSKGLSFAEWTREALLGALGTNSDVSGVKRVRSARRGNLHAGAHTRAVAEVQRLEDLANPESDRPVRRAGDCPHGVARGWRCTLCGGVVK